MYVLIKLCILFTYAYTSIHNARNILRLYVTSYEKFTDIQRLQKTYEHTLFLETLNNTKISKHWLQRNSFVRLTNYKFFR